MMETVFHRFMVLEVKGLKSRRVMPSLQALG